MDNRIRISEHFTLYDVQYNETAVRLGIVNEVATDAQVNNARALAVNVLEPIWRELGPQHITSWYRGDALERDYSRNAFARWCIAERRAIRDDAWQDYMDRKQHHTACAVTLRAVDNTALFEFIKTLPAFDVLQHKTHWVSVSFTANNQKRVIHE